MTDEATIPIFRQMAICMWTVMLLVGVGFAVFARRVARQVRGWHHRLFDRELPPEEYEKTTRMFGGVLAAICAAALIAVLLRG